jgi:hypothetical protein
MPRLCGASGLELEWAIAASAFVACDGSRVPATQRVTAPPLTRLPGPSHTGALLRHTRIKRMHCQSPGHAIVP